MAIRTRTLLAAALVLTSATVPVEAQSTINQIRFSEGVDEINELKAPVVDGSQMAALAIGVFDSKYDTKALFVRRAPGGLLTRGPEYKLAPSIDIGAVLADALNMQAKAMGFKMAAAAEAGWKLSGTVRDIFLESRQIPYGATLFYGYMTVDLRLQNPSGATATMPMRVHHYFGGYNAGIGRRDEAEAAAAQMLIEGAQDLLARANRAHIKAPPHSSIAGMLPAIKARALRPQAPAIRAIGLSGLPAASAALLAVLPDEPDENLRAIVINALASLGSPQSIGLLSTRYSLEDEDCRWYTLKAMDYINTPEALAVVSSAGKADKAGSLKRLAEYITKK